MIHEVLEKEGFSLLADGVFLKKKKIINPALQNRRYHDYLPLQLSAILELSYLDHKLPIHPSEIIVLDTETTGLSRSAGTIPFLTGFVKFLDQGLEIEQIFLSDVSKEDSYLNYITELLERYSHLVTYNGKAFDIPLLTNRCIMNRRRGRFPAVHFDLLSIMKRLIPKGELARYRQKDVENYLLNEVRSHDLAGEAVPQIYFDFVKYGEIGGLTDIIDHNSKDILGLAFLFLESIKIYHTKDLRTPALRSGIAHILSKNKKDAEALHILHTVVENKKGDLKYRDYLLLATLYKKEGRLQESLDLYLHNFETYNCDFSAIAAAKLLEHRFHLYLNAIQIIEVLLKKKECIYQKNDLEKRLNRLRRKSIESQAVS